METVGARLNAGTDDATLEVAELGRGILRDKVKLLNGVWCWRKTQKVVRHLIVVHAVQDKVIGLFTVPVDIGPSSLEGSVSAVVEVVGIRRDRTGREQSQLHVVAGSQRQTRSEERRVGKECGYT